MLGIAVLLFNAFALPVNGPWSGDTGIRVLQSDVLRLTGDLAVPYLGQTVDPANRWNPLSPRYFSWQGMRYYPKFSVAYAYLAAGIENSLGQAALVIPSVLGLLLSGLAVWWMLREVGSRLAAWAPLALGLATPLLFYAGEFWEHSLATGLATAGASSALVAVLRRSWSLAFIAGLSLGAGLWLRGELYAYLPAVAVALLWGAKGEGRRAKGEGASGRGREGTVTPAPSPTTEQEVVQPSAFRLPPSKDQRVAATENSELRTQNSVQPSTFSLQPSTRVQPSAFPLIVALAAGILIAAAPLWFVQQQTFGRAEGAQVAVDSPLVLRGQSTNVIVERMFRQWGDTIPGLLVPQGIGALWGVGGLVLLAAALSWRRGATRIGALTFLAGGAFVATLALTNLAGRLAPVDLVASFPVGVAVVLAARRPGGAAGVALQFLGLTAVGYLLAAIVTAPSSGGAQHGPRYLLSIYPLWIGCLLLAVDPWLGERGWNRRLVFGTLGLLAAVSLVTQLAGLRNLKVIKDQYARIVEVSASLPDGPLVTDLWWYPQVTPDEVRRRPIFLLNDRAQAPELAGAMRQAGLRTFTYISSDEIGPAPNLSGPLLAGGSLNRSVVIPIAERKLVFSQYRIE